MSTNVTVKTKIRVNGQEYASVDDMPPDVRQAYDRALAAIGGGKHVGLLNIRRDSQVLPDARIVFNGQEYGSVGEMPAEVRRLYDGVMATLEADRQGSPGAPPAGASQLGEAQYQGGAAPMESTGSRLVIAGVVIAALLLASFVFGR